MKENIQTILYDSDDKDCERKIRALVRIGFRMRPECRPGEFWVSTRSDGTKELKVGREMIDDCQGQMVFNLWPDCFPCGVGENSLYLFSR